MCLLPFFLFSSFIWNVCALRSESSVKWLLQCTMIDNYYLNNLFNLWTWSRRDFVGMGKIVGFLEMNFDWFWRTFEDFDGSWLSKKVTEGFWYTIRVFDGHWRSLIVSDGLWLTKKPIKGLWRLTAVSEELWWKLIAFKDLWHSLLVS